MLQQKRRKKRVCFLRETVTEGERKSEEEKKGGYFRGYGYFKCGEFLSSPPHLYAKNGH